MNNPDACRYVRARLTEAGIANHHTDVRSRDMGAVSAPYANSVRTAVSMASGDEIPPRLAERIGRILADLPGYLDGAVRETHVVAYWDGGI